MKYKVFQVKSIKVAACSDLATVRTKKDINLRVIRGNLRGISGCLAGDGGSLRNDRRLGLGLRRQ